MTDVVVSEPSHIGRARRLASAAAQHCGLPMPKLNLVALAATELASNLFKHARRGVFTVLTGPDRLDLLALDRGPGIRQVKDCLRDGYSTTGTMGTGLGAVRRAADVFDIYSQHGSGTAVLARWHPAPPRRGGLRVGAALTTAPGETACGDMWTAAHNTGLDTIGISDGLGHGEGAARASEAAIASIMASTARSPARILDSMHAALVQTRGATVAIAQFARAEGRLRYCGIGNVAGRLYPAPGARSHPLMSRPGIVGVARASRVAETVNAWSSDAWLLMHTDGVSERWNADDWPGLFDHDPATVAGWVLGQCGRGRDDACVVAVSGGTAG